MVSLDRAGLNSIIRAKCISKMLGEPAMGNIRNTRDFDMIIPHIDLGFDNLSFHGF